MSKYLIAIDESGSFSPTSNNSVGGYVAVNTKPIVIEDFLRKQCQSFKPAGGTVLSFPGDLHYIPLRSYEKRIENNSGITITEENGIAFTDQVIRDFSDSERISHVIYSKGNVDLHIQSEQTYRVHLETVLFGYLSEHSFTNEDTIKVMIASRAIKLLGVQDWGFSNAVEYRKRFATYLQVKCCALTGLIPGSVTVQIKAVEKPEFRACILADFLISALTNSNGSGIAKRDKIKSFDVVNHLYYLQGDLETYFSTMSRDSTGIGLISVMLLGATFESTDRRRTPTIDILKRELEKISDNDLLVLGNTLKVKLEEAKRLRGREPDKLETLAIAECILDTVLSNFTNWTRTPQRKRFMHQHLWRTIEFHAHGIDIIGKKRDVVKDRERFHSFTELYMSDIYTNPVEACLDRIEKHIVEVQDVCFNTLDFASVDKFLREDIDGYRKLSDCAMQQWKSSNHVHNNLMAKLLGTSGQAYAFLGDSPGSSDRQISFDLALQLLNEDLKLLPVDTTEWLHGNNFRVTLYWLRGELKEALTAYFWNKPVEETLSIAALSIFDNAELNRWAGYTNKKDDRFILTNQLRLLALAIEQGCDSIDKGTLPATLRVLMTSLDNTRGSYPNNLSRKWISYLLFLCGQRETAAAFLSGKLTSENTNIVITLMRAVEFSLLAGYSDNEDDLRKFKRKTFAIINPLLSSNQHVAEFFKKSVWIQWVLSKDDTMTVPEPGIIARALPFYYS